MSMYRMAFGKMKTARDKYVRLVEKMYRVLSLALILGGLCLMLTGVGFISDPMWDTKVWGFENLELQIGIMIIVYVVVTWISGGIGIIISYQKCNNICITLYGIFMLFVISLPLLSEGSALMAFDRIDQATFDARCKLPIQQLRMEHSGIILSLFNFAHRFDSISETVVDTYMCSETCPCLDYTQDGKNSKLLVKKAIDGREKVYNRTFDTMVFKSEVEGKDEAKVFKSFDACFKYWLKEAENDDSINIKDVFKVSNDGGYNPRLNQEKHSRTVREQKEIDLYDKLEKNFECSGMCQSGLFYFTKELHEGQPEKTCFTYFKTSFHATASTFSLNSIFCGIISLIIGLTNCCLCSRPSTRSEENMANQPHFQAHADSIDNSEMAGQHQQQLQHNEIQLQGLGYSDDMIGRGKQTL